MTSLADAIQYRSLKEVQKILDENPSLLNKKSRIGETPLHIAVYANKIKVVEYLIQRGADVNTKAGDGDTPLITAVSKDRSIKIVKLLIDAGADIKAKREKKPVICWAAGSGNHEAVELLLKNGAELDLNSAVFVKPVAYFREIFEKDPKAIRKAPAPNALLNAAMELSYYDEDKKKPLELVELFLKHGANPNLKSNRTYPLVQAVYLGSRGVKIAKVLLEYGAKHDIKADTRRSRYFLYDLINEPDFLDSSVKKQFKALLKKYGAKL